MAEETVNDLTQCAVCFEFYNENGENIPRILPCYCTLCEACIKKLIQDNKLECPLDRQTHPASKGEKSFPQNKYILSYLKKELKPREAAYDECPEHKMKMVLYCKHKECKKAMCPVCMSENHLTHDVVNILQEQKSDLLNRIEDLTKNFQMQRENIALAKQQTDHDYEKIVDNAKTKLQELHKNFDAADIDLADNGMTLLDIREKVQKSTDQQDLANKREFVNVLKAVSRNNNKSLEYKFFELVETTKSVESSGAVGTLKQPQEPELKKRVREVTSTWTCDKGFSAMEVLSDGSVVTCRFSTYDHGWQMILRDPDGGNIIFERNLFCWARGLAEVTLNGQQCLAVSFGDSSEARIEFYDIPHLYRFVQGYRNENIKPRKLFAKSTSVLLVEQQGSHVLWHIDCNTSPPKFNLGTSQLNIGYYDDACITQHGTDSKIIYGYATVYCKNLHSAKVYWGIQGAVTGKQPLCCSSLRTDGLGYLFVCDTSNKCVHLFSTDGIYVDCVVKEGDYGLGCPQIIRWCKKTESLVLAHVDKQTYSVSRLKLNI